MISHRRPLMNRPACQCRIPPCMLGCGSRVGMDVACLFDRIDSFHVHQRRHQIMQAALLVVTLSLSTVGCHNRFASGLGGRFGCYGGGFRQACYSSCYGGGGYGGGYSRGWAQPAGFPAGPFGGYGVGSSGQMMGYAPMSGAFTPGNYSTAYGSYGAPTNTSAYGNYAPGTIQAYGTPGSTTYPPVYGSVPGSTTPPSAYGYNPAGTLPAAGTPGTTTYSSAYGNVIPGTQPATSVGAVPGTPAGTVIPGAPAGTMTPGTAPGSAINSVTGGAVTPPVSVPPVPSVPRPR
jgi:hypothetical protein